MEYRPADQQRVFLSTLPAQRAERRAALGVVLACLAISLTAAPFAKVQLPRVEAFIPIYESALTFNDLITAVLLFGQFSILRSRGILLLACAYLFTGLMVVAHMLSFPGLFAESGLLSGGPQTTAWLYMFWHSVFPLLVVFYALQPRADGGGEMQTLPRTAIAGGILLTFGAVGAFVALTTIGHDLLPPVMAGNRMTPAITVVMTAVWLCSLAAVGLLWRRKPHSVLDLWLMVVLCAWLCEVALAVILNAGRFDLGFYAGRIFGFAATGVVLVVLLLETRALYARLAQSLEAERTLLQRANQELEARVAERTRQLEAEIVEREKAQETLREAQKLEAIGRMAGGIAHDFNNLLTVIQGNAEILQDSRLSEDDVHCVKAIDRAAERGSRLVRQILTFSRRQPLKVDVVDLRQRSDELSEMLGRAVRGDIRLIVSMAEDLWPIACDVAELEIALMNLCVNARDAMPKGGLVRVEGHNCTLEAASGHPAALAGDFVAVSVADGGTGIAPEDIKKAFEPFFTTKEIGKGTGLGLSQVYGFAQQSGGIATIDSKVGEGTTVTVYLPRAKSEAVAEQAPDRQAVSRASGTALLVEDDEDVADVAKNILKLIGYRADHVRDGATALALLLSGQKFDLLFSDIIMPGGMSGLDLARKVRQHFPGLPILLCSGYARATGEVFREGFEIIAKPYTADSLAEAVRRTLTKAEQNQRVTRDRA
ncbi:MASE4 domain-containing protein [Dongia deserti]|uniref:MASE4 domain-containing protein n=1 Tax=Dongia deserti TaxID=2268030 RepID=UPI000E64E09D|nr:MASE4 domain-containing protein [Dongia deserti]